MGGGIASFFASAVLDCNRAILVMILNEVLESVFIVDKF